MGQVEIGMGLENLPVPMLGGDRDGPPRYFYFQVKSGIVRIVGAVLDFSRC